jgi:hypothetical protein
MNQILIELENHEQAMPQELLRACTSQGYKQVALVVWLNPGIRTHELSNYGIKSNNHHNSTQAINRHTRKLGWQIIKRPEDGNSKSWAWYWERA